MTPATVPTREKLLDAAEELVQTRGYNAFSFRDLAKRVGIRAASVHHYFPSKADLGRRLMDRYRRSFGEALEAISSGARDPRRRLEKFVGLFRDTLRRGDRLCMCGMLATEYATLPAGIRTEVRRFYGDSEAWLTDVFNEGRRTGRLRFAGKPAAAARTFFGALEGAMIAARAFGDERRLASAGQWLVQALKTTA
jgi:TetR/AcrR family transcriptional repressor of nem operon